LIVEKLFFASLKRIRQPIEPLKVVFASRNGCSDLQIAMSLAHNSSSRTEPAATYLRKLSRISINKFCADGRTVFPLSRNCIFASPPTLLTLLIATTSRAPFPVYTGPFNFNFCNLTFSFFRKVSIPFLILSTFLILFCRYNERKRILDA